VKQSRGRHVNFGFGFGFGLVAKTAQQSELGKENFIRFWTTNICAQDTCGPCCMAHLFYDLLVLCLFDPIPLANIHHFLIYAFSFLAYCLLGGCVEFCSPPPIPLFHGRISFLVYAVLICHHHHHHHVQKGG
jgi:hypothetical protein